MLLNYLKIALRVLARRRFFTAISLFGIAFTLMVLLILAAAADNALTAGGVEPHLDRMLHVSAMQMRGERFRWVGDPGYAFLDRYVRDMPGVEVMALHTVPEDAVSYLDGEKIISRMMHADGAYWRIFDFEFLEGNAYTDDDERDAAPVAVISRATRRRFFGGEPAVGRHIECDRQRFRVVGVVEDVPLHRVHAWADIWTPISTIRSRDLLEQLMGGFNAVLLATDRGAIPRIKEEFRTRLTAVEFPDPAEFDRMIGMPLTRLEEYAAQGMRTDENGEPRVGWLVGQTLLLGLGFMLLPTINLISLNVSRILERASEIGVRKAFGASAAHLVGQFILENIVLCVIGSLIALAGTAAVMTLVDATGLIPNAEFTINLRVFVYAFGLAVFFGVLSGAYPAWRMSRLHPVEALRGGAR